MSLLLGKKDQSRNSTGNGLKLHIKSIRWLLKVQKYAVFERLAAVSARPLAIADCMRSRPALILPITMVAWAEKAQEIRKKRVCLPWLDAFFERRVWLLNHAVRIGARHWPLRACVFIGLRGGTTALSQSYLRYG